MQFFALQTGGGNESKVAKVEKNETGV